MAVLGTTVRSITSGDKEYVLADVPMFEGTIGGTGKLMLTLDVGITWGVKGGTSADPYFGDALRWYPVPYIGLFAQGRFGTLLFNNITVLGSTGVDVEVPISARRRIIVGVEYFNRLVKKVGGFLDGDQWYASGDGLGIRIALGFLPDPGKGGP
jgi:hypothetical protein